MKYRMMRVIPRMVFFASLFLCLCAPHVGRASTSLSITEIMYDPAGSDDKREWVEVYNGGSTDIDMSGHYILTDGLSSTHHVLTPQGSSVIPAGSYAVIVQDVAGFEGDYPGYAGILFDSSWSGLTSTAGKTIAIIDAQSNVLDSVTYDPSIGGDNDGDSLQKNDAGVWIAAAPTPGAGLPDDPASGATDGTAVIGNSSSETNGDASVVSTTTPVASTKSVLPALPELKAVLSVPLHATAGISVAISDKVYGYSGELRTFGATHFALGDGASYDGSAMQSFDHTYAYPGTYVVDLQYKVNPYLPDVDVETQATIEVLPPSVAITAVASDGSIQLTNPGSRQVDISGWILAPDGNAFASPAFHVPAGTIILPAQKIVLSHEVTGLSFADAESSTLMLPSGMPSSAFADLADSTAPESSVPSPTVLETTDEVPVATSAPVAIKTPAAPAVAKQKTIASHAAGTTTATDLSASAIGAVANGNARSSEKKDSPLVPIVLGFAGLALLVLAALYKKSVRETPFLSESRELAAESDTRELAETVRIVEE